MFSPINIIIKSTGLPVANIVANPIFVNLNIPRYITLYIVCKSKMCW